MPNKRVKPGRQDDGNGQPFVEAMRRATFIPGMLWPREMHGLNRLFSQSVRHVEVGVFCGKSLFITAAAMSLFGPTAQHREIVAVDDFSERFHHLDSDLVPSLEWWRTTLEGTIKAIEQQYAVDVRLLDTCSIDAARELRHETFDSVYIDANHAEAAVSLDIASWWPVLKPDGTMAGHDYSADRLGTMNAVNNAFADSFQLIPQTRLWWARKTKQTSLDVDRFLGSV